ncbi:MAG TPA: family 1 glycosylhydrolase [Alloacidobacterium sp.]|nr:family 1 glycosylhydrolase [Alloacidobacterium sp.]
MITRRSFLGKSTALAGTVAIDRTRPLLAMMQQGTFPKDFLWGAATAAMQIEGTPMSKGGGESVWEPFLRKPHATLDGNTNTIADDSYNRWQEDIDIIRQIGLNAYRFSISWPRVLPEGAGRINQQALDHYDKFIDALLKINVTPVVTVYHFDYPEALQKKGGWLNPDSSKWLADYAELLAKRYSDRVRYWLTINEPNIFWSLSSEATMFPPAEKQPPNKLVQGSINILQGHGRSVQAIRATAKQPVKIGMPIAGMINMPATESAADIAAARDSSFTLNPIQIIPGSPGQYLLNNAWWLDPIFLGKYNESGLSHYGKDAVAATDNALKVIHQPIDYCAVNLYFGAHFKAGADGKPEKVPDPPNITRTPYGWAVTPDILYWGPKFLYERYNKSILVTENGMSWNDTVSPDGQVHDPVRVRFIHDYLKAYRRAIGDGVKAHGYFYWSLLDNFEFTQGFKQRFGITYVNFKTLKRTLKDSALDYRKIIQSNGANL